MKTQAATYAKHRQEKSGAHPLQRREVYWKWSKNGKPDLMILADIVKAVVRAVQPDKIVLFGSAARGEMGPDSDYDILVIKAGKYNFWRELTKIRKNLPGTAPVDVVLATPEVVEQYRDTHCLVYCPAMEERSSMTRRRFPPADPREWLNRARSNLAYAKMVVADVYLEENCFNAQQCAEKAIKAVFIDRGETFPYIHNLKELLTLLERNGMTIPKYLWESDELSPYAALTRYPGRVGPITPRKHRRAVRIATAVLRWAERQVAPPAPRSKGKK